jgi:hypothetical protein
MATESNTYNDYSVAATDEFPLISNFSHWHKPQIGETLWDVNPLETDTGEFMKMGLMKRVKGEEIIHHEARSRFDVPKVNSSATQASVYGTASTGNGDPADFDSLDYIQLALESHSPSGAGTTQYTKSYPRVGQHIMFANGAEWRIRGKRTTIAGAHRLYLQKVQAAMASLASTITLAGGVYGGNSFIVFTTSHGEQTLGQTEGMVPTSKTFTSYLQTFSDFYKVTDWEMQNETYPLKWNGQTIEFTYHKGINDTEIRWGAMIDNGLFLANKDEGTLTALDPETGEDEAVTTTQGYIQNLELNANPLLYDTTPTMALYDQIGRLRRKLLQGKNCMKWVGYEYRTATEGIVTTLGINGGIVYDRQAVDLNIQQIKKGGAVYNVKDLDIMNHPKFGGAPGFKFPFYFIIAPMLKEKDSKNGNMLDPFNVLYKMPEGEGTRGHYKIWMTGAFAERATNARANRVIHLYCRMGTQTVGGSKHILGKPVTLS